VAKYLSNNVSIGWRNGGANQPKCGVSLSISLAKQPAVKAALGYSENETLANHREEAKLLANIGYSGQKAWRQKIKANISVFYSA
jgi:hypothetical protein